MNYRSPIGRITPHARSERPVRQSTPLGAWAAVLRIALGLSIGFAVSHCLRQPTEPRVWLHEPVAKESRK